jgi:sugar phosphate isomerase/epimerase
MSMRLSMGDTVFPLVSNELCLDIALSLGFVGVDLFAIPGMSRLQPDEILSDQAGTAAAVKERYQSRGLAISDFFPHPGDGFDNPLAPNTPIADDRARSRAWFEAMVSFAGDIDTPGITLMPGVSWPDETPEASLERAGEELAWRADTAAKAGISFSVEPHIDSVVATPDAVTKLIELAPQLRLSIDYSHFIRDGFDDDACEPLLEYSRHVHCRAASKSRLQEALKNNVIDFPRMVATLAAHNYDGYLCCENIWFEPLGCDDVDNMSETIMLRDILDGAITAATASEAARTTA